MENPKLNDNQNENTGNIIEILVKNIFKVLSKLLHFIQIVADSQVTKNRKQFSC